MAALSTTYAELRSSVGRMVGWGSSSGSWSADQGDTLDECLEMGYRTFLDCPIPPDLGGPWNWSFLEPIYILNLNAPYTTGTVGASSGVVTLTGGTFPSWAAQGELQIAGGSYSVSTRDSNTQVTLEDTSVTIASGTTYTLYRSRYDLPADFAGFRDSVINYANDERLWGSKQIALIGEGQFRMQNNYGTVTAYPQLATHYIKTVDDPQTADQTWVVEFWPPPDQAYTVQFRYRAYPPKLSSTNTTPVGGAQFAECIRQACLAAGELLVLDEANGPHHQHFMRSLITAVAQDKALSRPNVYGYNRDRSDTYDFPDTQYDIPISGIPPGDIYSAP